MDTAAMTTSQPTNSTARRRSILPATTVCALTATGVNLVLRGIGRAAGASFMVDPALGDPNVEVGGLKVVVTTLLPFAAGVLLLALVARRSSRWVAAGGVVGVAVAVASAAGPLAGGHDTTTGVLLATMHLTTGAAFVVAATKVRANRPRAAHRRDPLTEIRSGTRLRHPVDLRASPPAHARTEGVSTSCSRIAGGEPVPGIVRGQVKEGARMRQLGAAVGSATFFVVAPGVVAGVVHWLVTGWEVARPVPWSRVVLAAGGLLLITAGVVVLTDAFARFVREGRGTPAPVAPTEQLVVGGLYRYVRNPMYVAVVAIIVGQALVFGRPLLLSYAVAVWAAMAAFVHWYEEPILARKFGASYEAYRVAVPAWWPRRRSCTPDDGDA
jgi:protein-S-isoprenylcysteine O-methyltransferase Ste14